MFNGETKRFTFGLLPPGAGESEIFPVPYTITFHGARQQRKVLMERAIANDAQVRQNNIMKIPRALRRRADQGRVLCTARANGSGDGH